MKCVCGLIKTNRCSHLGISGIQWLSRSILRAGTELHWAFLVENTYCHSSKSHTSLGITCQLNNPAVGDMGDLAEKTELLMILFSLLPLAIDAAGNGSVLVHVISSSNNLSLGALFNSYSAFNCTRNKAKGQKRPLNLYQVLLKHGVNKFLNNHGGVSNLFTYIGAAAFEEGCLALWWYI